MRKEAPVQQVKGEVNDETREQETYTEQEKSLVRIREWWRDPYRDRPNWSDKAIVFLTLGIVLLAYMQWREMHDSGTQTDKIIAADERIAGAMEKTLGQAQQTLTATTQQTEIAQRAWVYVVIHPAEPEHFSAGKPFDIRTVIKNTGRTPALRLRTTMYSKVVDKKTYHSLSLPAPVYPPREKYLAAGNMNPESSSYVDSVMTFTQQDVERIDNMDVRIYLFGRIEYEDVFGTPHWFTFCSFLIPGGDFAICPKYNEMDNKQPQVLIAKPN